MLGFIVEYSKAIDFLKDKGRVYQDALLKVPAGLLRRHGVSPDAVTLLSMVLVLVSSILLFRQDKLYLLVLPSAVFVDMLDGTLARMYAKERFGILFDYFSDRFSDAMLILALVASGMLDYYLALFLLFFYVVSTLLTKLLENMKIKVYILSFRILAMIALFLNELYGSALLLVCYILLLDYACTTLAALPRVFYRK
ncbi:MAG: CDP-alcohol phosphatidyltransferase family protein [Candidatus Altiarchaeota archaeon]